MTQTEGKLSPESLAGRARRAAATIRPAAGWLAVLLVSEATLVWVAFHPAIAATVPLWAFAVVLLSATVTTWLFLRAALGYRPASPCELAQLQAGSLWHVSTADLFYELDAGHCRWLARMIRRDRFFARRQAAVYVFSMRPSMGEVRGQVTARRRGTLYRLEGRCVTGAFIRHTGEVALLGYTGPIVAEIQLSGREASGSARSQSSTLARNQPRSSAADRDLPSPQEPGHGRTRSRLGSAAGS